MKKNFKNLNILVFGDISLDAAISGTVERISPEAPVPIVLESSRSFALGCAGNVAACVAALGATATLLGVVGDDEEAEEIKKSCALQGIISGLVMDDTRPTTCKTRVFAKHHQLLRIDHEDDKIISSAIEKKIIIEIEKLAKPNFVIVSDYHKGTLTGRIMETLRRVADGRIVADFKPKNADLMAGVFAITPNLKEAHELTGLVGSEESIAADIARTLANRYDTSVILKRSEYGMTIFDKNSGTMRHISSRALKVFDVAGAGDTVIAAAACMLANGADLFEAAEFANRAAGIVVGKEGVATVSLEEMENG